MIRKYQFTGNGFTLVEMLIVIAILSVVGVLILTIFTRTLRGNNKSQIIGAIKQNGQLVLETMDKTIRNSDRVVCAPGLTIVVVKEGKYTRYRFTAPNTNSSPPANGYLQQEIFGLPSSPPSGGDQKLFIRDFESTICTDPSVNPQILTDTNLETGVSVDCIDSNCNTNPVFKGDKPVGYKAQVTINFALWPGVQASQIVRGQIDATRFQTTIQLR